MASLVVLGVATAIIGTCIGAFLKLSFAIRREDGTKGSLRFDAPDRSTQAARSFVGINSSRWD